MVSSGLLSVLPFPGGLCSLHGLHGLQASLAAIACPSLDLTPWSFFVYPPWWNPCLLNAVSTCMGVGLSFEGVSWFLLSCSSPSRNFPRKKCSEGQMFGCLVCLYGSRDAACLVGLPEKMDGVEYLFWYHLCLMSLLHCFLASSLVAERSSAICFSTFVCPFFL